METFLKSLSCRGTKGFFIRISNSTTGPWTLFYTGELEDPRPYGWVNIDSLHYESFLNENWETIWPHLRFRTANDIVPLVTLSGNGTMEGRYVNFTCWSWYDKGCCLNYIGVARVMGWEDERRGEKKSKAGSRVETTRINSSHILWLIYYLMRQLY